MEELIIRENSNITLLDTFICISFNFKTTKGA